MSQKIIFANSVCSDLDEWIENSSKSYDRIFTLSDTTTAQLCLPLLQQSRYLSAAPSIVIGSTDEHKNLESLAEVWKMLGELGATRHSLLVNIGGGMVTDLGGFAASTFKRGIDFINVPTTLLAMVDAAVGGKTGINFNGFKNEIGVFNESCAVVVDTTFLRSLDQQNLRSGYAEMLKHALLSNEKMLAEHLNFDLANPDYPHLQQLVADSIAVKQQVVAADPHEQGLRKALNLGHTVGHAFESLALELHRPVLHGYAVAWGLMASLYLSVALTHFPEHKMRQVFQFIRDNYGRFDFTCDHYDKLFAYMKHDKKNVAGVINFTLLGEVGDIRLDEHASKELLEETFDFLRES